MKIQFTPNGLEDYRSCSEHDSDKTARIKTLLEAINTDPFSGIGKPEPLLLEPSGYWSRRIDLEHRLVYRISDDGIIVVSCRYPYKNELVIFSDRALR